MKEATKQYLLQLLGEKKDEIEAEINELIAPGKAELEGLVGYIDDLALTDVEDPAPPPEEEPALAEEPSAEENKDPPAEETPAEE